MQQHCVGDSQAARFVSIIRAARARRVRDPLECKTKME